jgi:hypothetical protein
VRFEKINAVILGFLSLTVLGWKQILIAHPLPVPVIKRLVFDDPAIRGTGACSTKHQNAKDKTEKNPYKWFRAQPMLNANVHIYYGFLRFSKESISSICGFRTPLKTEIMCLDF